MALTVAMLDRGNGKRAFWEAVDGTDTGAAVDLGGYPDRTVTVTGTFNGTTITIQGSNDNSVWQTLSDPAGIALTFTAAGVKVIAEATQYVRQTSAGGGGSTDVDVIVMATR